MPPKVLRGALKNKGEKVYTSAQSTGPIPLVPGSLYMSSAIGIVKRGVDLQACYQGQYNADGKRHGYGVYKYANGMEYEGEFVNGEKHGPGKLTFKHGGHYEGRFEHDEMNGQGTRRFANGNTWVGSFVLGDMHGPGTMTFANGDRFEGSMQNNVMQGSGQYRFKNGNMYRGDFKDNRLTGQGVMSYSNGDRYKGDWVNGKRHGRGRCSYANGDHYTGAWAEDLYHGEGSLVYASRGIWYEGRFVRGAPSLLPTKLGVFWYTDTEDPAAAKLGAGGKKPVAAAAKPGDTGGPPPILPNTVGSPLAVPLVVAAQLAEADPQGSSAPAKEAGAASPPSPTTPRQQPVHTESPPSGCSWRTSTMENGRKVYLTLHHAVPQAANTARPIGVQIVTTLCSDGSVTLRLLLLPAHLGPALPIKRVDDSLDAIRCLELSLEKGQHQLESACMGDPASVGLLQCPDGVGYLVASCGWGLQLGYCRVALPSTKAAVKK